MLFRSLKPEDGVYLLPYMARQADGKAWEDDMAYAGAPEQLARQPFYPDASRLFEEIDRLGLGETSGLNNLLASRADYDFVRVVPSGGYKKGLAAGERSDLGDADIAPERLGHDFFNYRPFHLWRDPPRAMMARVVNLVQAAMDSGRYAGGIWLEGSPNLEEMLMWMNLLIDTALPICGNSSQRPHGSLANDGDRNIVDSVNWILSDAWRDERGDNREYERQRAGDRAQRKFRTELHRRVFLQFLDARSRANADDGRGLRPAPRDRHGHRRGAEPDRLRRGDLDADPRQRHQGRGLAHGTVWRLRGEPGADRRTGLDHRVLHRHRLCAGEARGDRKSTRLNSSHIPLSRMPSSA